MVSGVVTLTTTLLLKFKMPDYASWVELSLDTGNYAETINVYMNLGYSQSQAGESGVITPPASRPEVKQRQTLVIAVSGSAVENGGVLSPDGNGSIPLSYRGQLILDNAVFVDEDLFED